MQQGYLGLRSFARRKPRHNANGTVNRNHRTAGFLRAGPEQKWRTSPVRASADSGCLGADGDHRDLPGRRARVRRRYPARARGPRGGADQTCYCGSSRRRHDRTLDADRGTRYEQMSPRALLAETLKLNARASRHGSGATGRGRYQIIARLTPGEVVVRALPAMPGMKPYKNRVSAAQSRPSRSQHGHCGARSVDLQCLAPPSRSARVSRAFVPLAHGRPTAQRATVLPSDGMGSTETYA
jgi:hypothetical protein